MVLHATSKDFQPDLLPASVSGRERDRGSADKRGEERGAMTQADALCTIAGGDSATVEFNCSIFHDSRADPMVKNDEGLTATHNLSHDPDERSPDILCLGELYTVLGREIVDANSGTDFATSRDLLLDCEYDDETWGNKKEPLRFCWHDVVHDEVFNRLIDRSQRRYGEEGAAGLQENGSKKTWARKVTRRKRNPISPTGTSGTLPIFILPNDGGDA